MTNIVVCDDSQEYLEIISYKIRHCMDKKINMECSIICINTLEELTEYSENNKVDILFLDIMHRDINAMNWSIENMKSGYTQIIFMTAFPQSAYNISESNCCYYLVKSKITDESLVKAIRRALQNATKKRAKLNYC